MARGVPLPTPPKEGLTPDLDLEPWKADGWDALCLVCGDGGDVACCDGCPAAFHAKCVGLNPDNLPEGDWFCPRCKVRMSQDERKGASSVTRAAGACQHCCTIAMYHPIPPHDQRERNPLKPPRQPE